MSKEFHRISVRQMRGCSFEQLYVKANKFLERSKKLPPRAIKNFRTMIEECTKDFIDALELNIEKFQFVQENDATYMEFINEFVSERAGVLTEKLELKNLTRYVGQIETAKAEIDKDPQCLINVFHPLKGVPESVVDLFKYVSEFVPSGVQLFCAFPVDQFKRSVTLESTVRIWKEVDGHIICVNPSLITDSDFCLHYRERIGKIKSILLKSLHSLEKQETALRRKVNRKLKRARNKLSAKQLEEIRNRALLIGFILPFNSELERFSAIDKRRSQIVAFRRERMQFLDECFGRVKTVQLSWKFFPQGEWEIEAVLKQFSRTLKPEERLDPSRIRKIKDNLDPSLCYVGTEGFNRYIAFGFEWTEKVVLECPIYGNAIYVISGNWQEITMHSKWEARRRREVKVIRHDPDWFSRLRSALR